MNSSVFNLVSIPKWCINFVIFLKSSKFRNLPSFPSFIFQFLNFSSNLSFPNVSFSKNESAQQLSLLFEFRISISQCSNVQFNAFIPIFQKFRWETFHSSDSQLLNTVFYFSIGSYKYTLSSNLLPLLRIYWFFNSFQLKYYSTVHSSEVFLFDFSVLPSSSFQFSDSFPLYFQSMVIMFLFFVTFFL